MQLKAIYSGPNLKTLNLSLSRKYISATRYYNAVEYRLRKQIGVFAIHRSVRPHLLHEWVSSCLPVICKSASPKPRSMGKTVMHVRWQCARGMHPSLDRDSQTGGIRVSAGTGSCTATHDECEHNWTLENIEQVHSTDRGVTLTALTRIAAIKNRRSKYL